MITLDLDQRLQLDLQRDLIGRRIAILGDSKQGKTNTAAVLVEELLGSGLPLTIIDFKGEYQALRSNHPIRVIGRGSLTDLRAGPEQGAFLAALSVAEGLSMLLDLSTFTADEQTDFLLAYLAGLWAATNKKRTPYGVIFEEGIILHPEGEPTPLKELFHLIALYGHQRGFGTIILSKPHNGLTFDFIRQQDILFLHGIVHPSERLLYKDLIPLPSKKVEELFYQMQPGQAVVVHNTQVIPVRIKPWQQQLFNPNSSLLATHQPKLLQDTLSLAGQIQKNNKNLLDTLGKSGSEAEMAKIFGQVNKPDPFEWYQKRNEVLQEEINRLNTIILDQSLELATLKDLKAYLETQPPVLPHLPGFYPPLLPPDLSNQYQPPQHPLPLENGRKHEDEQNFRDSATEPADFKSVQQARQLRKLKPFLYRLNDLGNQEAILLAFLLAHEGVFFTRMEILKLTGLFIGNFHQNFKNLLKTPFVEEETVPQVRIRSRTKEWAKENFPGLEPNKVIKEIKKYL